MVTISRAGSFASVAALFLAAALAAPNAHAQSAQGATTYQFQDSSSNSLRERTIRQSAGSAAATPTATQPFQDTSSNSLREQVIRQSAGSSTPNADPRYASTAATLAGKRDVVGMGGAQDDLARQIYQPGSRPAGW